MSDDSLESVKQAEQLRTFIAVAELGSSATYATAALAGLGLVQVPEVGVRDRLQSGEFIEVLSDFRPAPLPVTLLYPARRNLPLRVRVFMDWLTTLLQPRMSIEQKR